MNVGAILWLALLVVFIAAEAATVTMVSAWFAAGSLAAMLVSILGGQAWLQGLVFFTVSAVLLLLLRPIARKHFTPRLTKTNVDSVVGSVGMVTEDIDNLADTGRVRLGALSWSARSTQNTCIPAGTQVKADRVEGVKVYVTAVEAPAQPQL